MGQGFYSFSAQVISRGKGRSAVAAAAYRSGQSLDCEREGMTHDYTKKRGIESVGIALPDAAPAWAGERQALWNSVEKVERYKNAQVAREYRIAFPHQLTAEQRHTVLQEFIQAELTSKGYAADWAIHKPDTAGDCRNHHAHVMAPMRPFTDEGELARTKPQEWGNWNGRAKRLTDWRAAWADTLNEAATRYDLRDEQGERLVFDHRSFVSREIEQEPTVHLGVNATAMERRGIPTEIGDHNRAIKVRNAERAEHTEHTEKIIVRPEPDNDNEPEIGKEPVRRRGGVELPDWATRPQERKWQRTRFAP